MAVIFRLSAGRAFKTHKYTILSGNHCFDSETPLKMFEMEIQKLSALWSDGATYAAIQSLLSGTGLALSAKPHITAVWLGGKRVQQFGPGTEGARRHQTQTTLTLKPLTT